MERRVRGTPCHEDARGSIRERERDRGGAGLHRRGDRRGVRDVAQQRGLWTERRRRGRRDARRGEPAGGDGAAPFGALVIAPANQTIELTYGQSTPTVTYTATMNGTAVAASFAVDRGEIAAIASSGVLTPTGKVGGVAHVSATYQGQAAATELTVHVDLVDNGGASAGDAGVGGKGGVGGEGPGGPVSSTTQAVLQGPATADPGLAWLYPYDGTVWPRSLLAPLLQWSAPRDYDAVYLDLKETAFEYKGTFAKTATPFVHHPIPLAAWDALTFSNAGEPVTVSVVLSSGGAAYGPITETWKVALGDLKGTVYYQSYGTTLAQNSCCTPAGNNFGAATLAVKHGATDPILVTSSTQCQGPATPGERQRRHAGHAAERPDVRLLALVRLQPREQLHVGAHDAARGRAGRALRARRALPGRDVPLLGPRPAQRDHLSRATHSSSTSRPNAARRDWHPRRAEGRVAGVLAGWKARRLQLLRGPRPGDHVSLAMMDFDAPTSTFSNLQVLFTMPAYGASGHYQFADWPSFLPTNRRHRLRAPAAGTTTTTTSATRALSQETGALARRRGARAVVVDVGDRKKAVPGASIR